ncbi:MAG: hypothetical protein ACTHKB_02165 [Burkholderiaceae bacterium]
MRAALRFVLPVLLIALLCAALPSHAAPAKFSFGVIAPARGPTLDEEALRQSIAETDADNLAFVAIHGIKTMDESCGDELYARRKALLDDVKNALVVVPAASDWVDCRNARGLPDPIERLYRLRDMFFTGEFSLGDTRIPLIRQSATPRFRSYGENAWWQIGEVLFATIDLPADNNHYVSDAGRNSEFEDRVIANREWLQRLFTIASYRRLGGMVLFCDGDPFEKPESRHDGFASVRKAIAAHARHYPGRVLIAPAYPAASQPAADEIRWHGNIGVLSAASEGWTKIDVDPAAPAIFSLAAPLSRIEPGGDRPR